MSKIAIIRGAGRGIGAETARLAAAAGYNVCISYVSDSKSAAHVVRDCEAAGRKAIAVRGNVENVANVSNLFVQCDQHLGPITLLLYNAGIVGKAT
ncbi:MAG: SDR family NAD(P)-dependent oxidoreductase, partial [Pseudomonadota bacterium]|nr:SDR family NAD(P)-dependent oxidoreductase [Pseudomonadota bacterium]